jgi:hypothetical protein
MTVHPEALEFSFHNPAHFRRTPQSDLNLSCKNANGPIAGTTGPRKGVYKIFSKTTLVLLGWMSIGFVHAGVLAWAESA